MKRKFFQFAKGVIVFGCIALLPLGVFAQSKAPIPDGGVLLVLYNIFSNPYLSSFLSGIIFASLVYILLMVRKPYYLYFALTRSASEVFAHKSLRDPQGTYQQSFSQFKARFDLTRRALFTSLLTLLIQVLAFLILSLVVLQAATEEDTMAREPVGVRLATTQIVGGGICKPGTVQKQSCGRCGTKARTCLESSSWGAFSSCEGEEVCPVQEPQPVQETPEPGSDDEMPPQAIDAFGDFSVQRIHEQVITTHGTLLYNQSVEIPQNIAFEIIGKVPYGAHAILWFEPGGLVKTASPVSQTIWQVVLPKNVFDEGVYSVYGYFATDTYISETHELAKIRIIKPAFVEPVKKLPEEATFELPPPSLEDNVLSRTESFWQKMAKIIDLIFNNPTLEFLNLFFLAPSLVMLHFFIIMMGLGIWRGKIIFLHPRFVFGKPKPFDSWGTVYDFLTKKPLSWSRVSLFQYETKRLLDVVYTDVSGRYTFHVKPGKYFLDVRLPQYTFPSLLSEKREYDEPYSDLYHQEVIEIAQDEDVITYDIPLDTFKKEETSKKIISRDHWTSRWHVISLILGGVSLISALLTVVFIPMIFLHGYLFLIARRYLRVLPKLKTGLVLDAKTKKPLLNAVVRCYDALHGRYLEAAVTDASGKFHMMLGKNHFYLTIEKKGYSKFRSEPLDLFQQSATNVNQVFSLNRMSPT
ncbi:MAG TPA: hypothetical protein VJA22_00495 [Patescibacteria group bacterium]|nr:hypothetical protein [Patescibacteria group bacterium]